MPRKIAFSFFSTLLASSIALLHVVSARSESLHVIAALEGRVEVKQGEEDERLAHAGDRLTADDEFYVPSKGYVAILCDDGNLWEPPGGVWRPADGCAEADPSEDAAIAAQKLEVRVAEFRQKFPEGDERAIALAHLYLARDLKEDALAYLNAAVDLGTENAAIYQYLGDAYRRMGQYQSARENYERALELADDRRRLQADARFGLGQTWLALGEDLKAIAEFEIARFDYLLVGAEEKAEETQQRIEELGGW